jgi:hypothetical protein
MMRLPLVLLLAAAATTALQAQERPVPKDSERISIPGCARGSAFVVTEPASYELVTDVAPGQRFRLAGSKDVLKDIKAREGSMVWCASLSATAPVASPSPAGVFASAGPYRSRRPATRRATRPTTRS